MSRKERVIDQLMQLSSWALEKAFAIEDNDDAGMAELEGDLNWLDDLAGALDEMVLIHSAKTRRIVHNAPARMQ